MKNLIEQNKIDIGYDFAGSSNYFILTINDNSALIDYQLQMIANNKTEFFLPVRKIQINNQLQLFYDITGKPTLSQLAKNEPLEKSIFLHLLESILNAIIEVAEFGLEDKGVLLDRKYIFLEDLEKVPSFIYLPFYRESVGPKTVADFITELQNDGLIGKEYELEVANILRIATKHNSTIEELLLFVNDLILLTPLSDKKEKINIDDFNFDDIKIDHSKTSSKSSGLVSLKHEKFSNLIEPVEVDEINIVDSEFLPKETIFDDVGVIDETVFDDVSLNDESIFDDVSVTDESIFDDVSVTDESIFDDVSIIDKGPSSEDLLNEQITSLENIAKEEALSNEETNSLDNIFDNITITDDDETFINETDDDGTVFFKFNINDDIVNKKSKITDDVEDFVIGHNTDDSIEPLDAILSSEDDVPFEEDPEVPINEGADKNYLKEAKQDGGIGIKGNLKDGIIDGKPTLHDLGIDLSDGKSLLMNPFENKKKEIKKSVSLAGDIIEDDFNEDGSTTSLDNTPNIFVADNKIIDAEVALEVPNAFAGGDVEKVIIGEESESPKLVKTSDIFINDHASENDKITIDDPDTEVNSSETQMNETDIGESLPDIGLDVSENQLGEFDNQGDGFDMGESLPDIELDVSENQTGEFDNQGDGFDMGESLPDIGLDVSENQTGEFDSQGDGFDMGQALSKTDKEDASENSKFDIGAALSAIDPYISPTEKSSPEANTTVNADVEIEPETKEDQTLYYDLSDDNEEVDKRFNIIKPSDESIPADIKEIKSGGDVASMLRRIQGQSGVDDKTDSEIHNTIELDRNHVPKTVVTERVHEDPVMAAFQKRQKKFDLSDKGEQPFSPPKDDFKLDEGVSPYAESSAENAEFTKKATKQSFDRRESDRMFERRSPDRVKAERVLDDDGNNEFETLLNQEEKPLSLDDLKTGASSFTAQPLVPDSTSMLDFDKFDIGKSLNSLDGEYDGDDDTPTGLIEKVSKVGTDITGQNNFDPDFKLGEFEKKPETSSNELSDKHLYEKEDNFFNKLLSKLPFGKKNEEEFEHIEEIDPRPTMLPRKPIKNTRQGDSGLPPRAVTDISDKTGRAPRKDSNMEMATDQSITFNDKETKEITTFIVAQVIIIAVIILLMMFGFFGHIFRPAEVYERELNNPFANMIQTIHATVNIPLLVVSVSIIGYLEFFLMKNFLFNNDNESSQDYNPAPTNADRNIDFKKPSNTSRIGKENIFNDEIMPGKEISNLDKAKKNHAGIYIPDTEETQLVGGNKVPYLTTTVDGTIQKIFLNKPSFLIGRHIGKVDYVSKSNKVGKLHLEIVNRNGVFYVNDLESKNGTYLNTYTNRLESEIEYPIDDGDIIIIADVEFTFHLQ